MNKSLLVVLFSISATVVAAKGTGVAIPGSDTAGFQISIPGCGSPLKESGDSIYFSGPPVINGEQFSVSWPDVKNIKVRQRYQTSVSVSPGGSHHYDLRNFVHGYTAWQSTMATDSGYAVLTEPAFTGKLPFPAVSQAKLRGAAKAVVNDAVLVGKITTPYAGPCSVVYSAVIIEISGTDNNNIQRKKIVVIELPMGC